MVLVSDVLIPARFLAFLGHFFAGLLALYAVRDSVIVALPFTYTTSDFDASITSARSSIWVLFACLAINACAFFFGFNTFNIGQGIFHLTFHSVAGMLIALTVINKGHFLYLWYIVLVFSTPQVLVDVSTFVAACVLGGKRRW